MACRLLLFVWLSVVQKAGGFLQRSSLHAIRRSAPRLESPRQTLAASVALQPSSGIAPRIIDVGGAGNGAASASGAMRVGVVLLNLGGPERSEDVEPFLYNLFADPDIIRLPRALSGLQSPLAWAIAKRRSPVSRAAYDSIGGGSPIVNYTRAQASDLEHLLNSGPLGVAQGSGIEWKTYVAMRYWYPFTDEALQQANDDGCSALVVLPLYPHFSISTSGSSLRELGQQVLQDYPSSFGLAHTVRRGDHSDRRWRKQQRGVARARSARCAQAQRLHRRAAVRPLAIIHPVTHR
jgi:ferrochelatase